MRSIKICSALLLMMAFSVSCEKESLDPTENQLTVDQDQLTFSEFVNSGVDVNQYISNVHANEVRAKSSNKSHSGASYEEAIFKEFCSDLPVEGFEKGRMDTNDAGIFQGPLNEDRFVGKFEPGEIMPGISISAEEIVLALHGQESRSNFTKVIYAQNRNADLFIDFTKEDVNSASLDILSFPYPDIEESQQVTVQVFDIQEELIHAEILTASITGTFWSITGDETISRIILSSTNEDAWVGVDNIAFGVCTIPDADNDGCLDRDDLNDLSNLEATVNVGSCDSGVVNRMTADCGVFMSDLIDILEAGTYRNKGEFVSSVASQTNLWVVSGLISELEKDALMSCAAGADIP